MDISPIIALAKAEFLTLWPEYETEAAFDYGLATGGESNAWLAIKGTLHRIANAGHENDPADPQEQRYIALWDKVKPALDAYAVSCRGRSYTGWSDHSAGPIQYADEVVHEIAFIGSPAEALAFLRRETGQDDES